MEGKEREHIAVIDLLRDALGAVCPGLPRPYRLHLHVSVVVELAGSLPAEADGQALASAVVDEHRLWDAGVYLGSACSDRFNIENPPESGSDPRDQLVGVGCRVGRGLCGPADDAGIGECGIGPRPKPKLAIGARLYAVSAGWPSKQDTNRARRPAPFDCIDFK